MIPLFKVFMAPTAAEEVGKVLNSGYIGEGPKVKEFEEVLKDYFKTDRVATTNSATSAEHLALLLLKNKQTTHESSDWGTSDKTWPGLNQGDTILCSPLTCLASNVPVPLGGYKIKWVDIDPLTLNMDLDDLARKLTPEVKAVIFPFWGGMPTDMHKLELVQEMAARNNGFKAAIIIDAAHSLGSTFEGKQVCDFGHITSYSFQAIKHITSINGGALILPHKKLYERAKLMRWYGISRNGTRNDFRCEENVDEIGTKYHLDDVSATVGIENMKHVNEIIDAHKANAYFYNTELSQDLAPRVASGITLLTPTPKTDSSYWIYTMLVEDRKNFMQKMGDAGIVTSRVHERNDKHTALKEFKSLLPNLESVIDKMICIPVHHGVDSEDRMRIVETIKSGW